MSDSQGNNSTHQPGDATASEVGDVQTPQADDTISLLDLLAVLARRWKLIFFMTFFAAVGVVLFSMYTLRLPPDSPRNPLPNYYRSEAQILLGEPGRGSSILGTLGNSELGILAGIAGIGRSEGQSSAALIQELLEGRSLIDQIVTEFDLLDRFRSSESPLETARRAVRNGLNANYRPDSGILTVTFESIDPVFANDVLQRVIMLVESRFTFLTRDEARARTEAIEAQIRQIEDDLTNARSALSQFQRRYGMIDPQNQGRQTIDLVAEFRRQMFELELEREQIYELVRDRNDPQIQRINQNVQRLGQLISELETGYRLYSPVSIPLDQIGPLSVEHADLQRDLALREQIYTTFQAELVRARIESQDTSRKFQVIEAPEVPLEKAGPSRGMLSIIVTITAFFLSVFLAFVFEYFDRAKSDPLEARKLEVIRDQFRFRKRT